jgi:predicted 2-oxoglutarate/Fe(II)-dependent dioxygenase YbiX
MCINITNEGFAERYGLNPYYYKYLAGKIKIHIEEKFNASNLREEQYLINRWRVGREQTPHLDYFYEEEPGHDYAKLEKNNIPKSFLDNFGKMFQTKHYSSLIYLNEDYDGGELYFPEHNFYIKPEVGTLICLKGDEHSLHGVKKVESGIRYTVSLFWEDMEYRNKIAVS